VNQAAKDLRAVPPPCHRGADLCRRRIELFVEIAEKELALLRGSGR